VISEAAHHLDSFFSRKDDTDAVIAARELEMTEIRKWINEKKRNGATVTAKTQQQQAHSCTTCNL
jgi:arginine deiminase